MFYLRLTAPEAGSVNGVYSNECCIDIVLREGTIIHGSKSGTFKLYNMKFGLTGYMNGKLTDSGIETDNEETAIAFGEVNGRRALAAPIDGKERVFVSIH